MKCIKVRCVDAESVRKALLEKSLLNKNYKIKRERNFVYIPVLGAFRSYSLIEKKLEKIKIKKSLKEELKDKLKNKELALLKTSFDTIGSIAVLEIDDELLSKKKQIADAVLNLNKNIKTVVRKSSSHEGIFRVQSYEYLAGIRSFKTVHKESGIVLSFDISKTYFTPRLANERLRIAKLVKEDEKVLVMFSGIGIYCFIISKYSKPKEIYGVEINPDAYRYAEKNLVLNKIDNVKLLCGNVKNVVPRLKKKFDRIIMPSPTNAAEYLNVAIASLKSRGFIHLYSFVEDNKVEELIEDLKLRLSNIKVLKVTNCGQNSPNSHRVCIDLKLQ